MKKAFLFFIPFVACLAFKGRDITVTIAAETTKDSLGACQGITYQDGDVYLYGDREVGVMRKYKLQHDTLAYLDEEYQFTIDGKDVINHPTGIARHDGMPTFIGNSVRLNAEGTKWKAVVYSINWAGLMKTGTLDGNLLNTIDDDTCVQGTRPEYVRYKGKWYVATADYGGVNNEIRLYDPKKLHNCKRTSEPGVLVKKIKAAPWIQNLHYVANKDILVLIQNQIEGRRWRLTFIDLGKSFDKNEMQVIKQIDFDTKMDELEGFSFVDKDGKLAIAVSSSRKNNAAYLEVSK